MKSLTVVIPSRSLRPIRTTLDNLQTQSFKDFITVVQPDFGHGANWARNRGFELCRTELVLFSDDDIEWMLDGIEAMIDALDAHPEATYSYGTYFSVTDGKNYIVSDQQFDAAVLRRNNFVSTMSVIRAKDFPGFDESLKRLQDWDLWLTLLDAGKVGVHCGKTVFKSVCGPDGITNKSIGWEAAYAAIRGKH